MAKTTGGEITWNLDLDAKNFDSGIKKAQDNVSGFQKAVDKASSAIASSMSSIDKAFRNAEAGSQLFLGSLTAIIGAAAGAAGFGIKMAADIETMTQGFVTLLGSTEEANKAIAMIKKDAAQTPFELPGLINANQLLTSVTKDAGRSETLLLNIGKALTSMGKGQPELDRIIVNLQQIGAVGKASMIDIKQFAFAGIPIFDMLKKKFAETGQAVVDNSKKISENGAKIDELKDKLKIAQQQQKEFTSETKKSTVMMKKNQIENYKQQIEKLSGTVGDLTSKNGELTNSGEELESMISDGKVTFELLEQLFNDAGTGAGQFAKAFELQGGTFNQLMSNFKDNIGIAASEIVKQIGLFDTVKRVLSDAINFIGNNTQNFVNTLNSLATWFAQNAPIIIGFIAGGITPALYGMAAAFIAATLPLLPFIVAGTALGLLAKVIIDNWGAVVNTWNNVTQAIENNKKVIEGVATFLAVVFGPAIAKIGVEAVIAGAKMAAKLIPEIISLGVQATITAVRGMADLVKSMVMFALEGWKTVAVVVAQIAKFIAWTTVTVAQALATGTLTAATWLLNAALAVLTSPITLVVAAIAGLVAIGVVLYKNWDTIKARGAEALSFLRGKWDEFWSFISKMTDKIKAALDKINPLHRNSPSLVDNVKAGLGVIKDEYDKLGKFTINAPVFDEGLSSVLGVEQGDGAGAKTVNQNINITIGKIADKGDVDAMVRELGFKGNQVIGLVA